jgi:hypothetical protein
MMRMPVPPKCSLWHGMSAFLTHAFEWIRVGLLV